MSDSPSPREGSDVVTEAEGTSGGEQPGTVFSDEDVQRARADQMKEARKPEDTPDYEEEYEETLGPGSPGMTVDPDGLR
ncbi:MAG: hypothetical protein M3133_01195 [Actinomycetota bacterium]|nr:hypothetical protein [Actinomycetota bacterium]